MNVLSRRTLIVVSGVAVWLVIADVTTPEPCRTAGVVMTLVVLVQVMRLLIGECRLAFRRR